MFTTDKVGDVMQAAMTPTEGKKWFGAAPPDLTLIARSRGADYLYAYLARLLSRSDPSHRLEQHRVRQSRYVPPLVGAARLKAVELG